MAGLWEEAAAAGLPALALATGDVSPAEKGAWEKELTGVYFTEDPYQRLRQAAGRGTHSCAEITEEMTGQRVVVLGYVSSLRPLMTKRGEPFAAVTLEDGSGSVEVTVWPNIYRGTQALWVPRAPLLVQGPVRVRGDSVSVECEQVRTLVPGETAPLDDAEASDPDLSPEAAEAVGQGPTEPEEAIPPMPPSAEAALGPGEVAPALSRAAVDPPARQGSRQPSPRPRPARRSTPSSNGKPRRYQLTLRLRETADEAADVERLGRLLVALEAHPGQDAVRLMVQEEGGRVTPLSLPQGAAYGPELAASLADVLGEGGLQAEEIRGG